ncbi:MAG: hypothetical protein WCC25_14205 [Candidatus Korobacteraceae bacterium]
MTQIAGVASAFPRHYYRQNEIANALKRHWNEGLENPKVNDRSLTLGLYSQIVLVRW